MEANSTKLLGTYKSQHLMVPREFSVWALMSDGALWECPHVGALQERLQARIVVQPNGDGTSKLTVS